MVLASVYAVPDVAVGDQVMATLLLHEGREFDPGRFAEFLAGEPDMGTKWAPKYVRINGQLVDTATGKPLAALKATGPRRAPLITARYHAWELPCIQRLLSLISIAPRRP